tara:strand:+ start:1202 stop:1564 length:363 start_codon:yes stop_codon:yes gene_type:complete
MARASVNINVLPTAPYGMAIVTDIASNAAAVTAAIEATEAAIDLALADPTISGDPTALGLVEDLETDNDAALVLAAASDAAVAGDIIISFDQAVVTSRTQLVKAFNDVVDFAVGNGLVTP